MKGFKAKSGIVCLESGKLPQLLRASLGRGEPREKPGTRPQVREEETQTDGRWAKESCFIHGVVKGWGRGGLYC